ncbi:uncharacterized protein LOC116306924 isoform X3 [Actinia tenebrosa]|uniref:Uncharacterized protein LOC116306924 isoform X3 n=1 Tax=Actinia tenebrosa TaxID=6105 RepID=A0A6P8J0F4_ACTTE|nr:uncharacterized protein LOC116306924 isoform X3 [Actinia tenebrosa]
MAFRITKQVVTPQDQHIHTWSMTDGKTTSRTRTFQDPSATTYYNTNKEYGITRNDQVTHSGAAISTAVAGRHGHVDSSSFTFSADGTQDQRTESLSKGSGYKAQAPTGFQYVTTGQTYQTGTNVNAAKQDPNNYQGRMATTFYQNGTTIEGNEITTNQQNRSKGYVKSLGTQRYQATERQPEPLFREINTPNRLIMQTYDSGEATRKEAIKTNKLDPTGFLQQQEQQSINRENIKPNRVAIPKFESQTEIKKEVIQSNKLDTTRFNVTEEEPKPLIRGPVKRTKLQTEFNIAYQEPDNLQFAAEQAPKPQRIKIPDFHTQADTRKEVIANQRINIPKFESTVEIKKEVIETGKLDTTRFLQQEEQQVMKREISKPKKLEIPMFESQAEIKKEFIETRKLDTGKFLQQQERQTINKETVKPNRINIPIFGSQADIKKEIIETNKLDQTMFKVAVEEQKPVIRGPIKRTKLQTEFVMACQQPENQITTAVERKPKPQKIKLPDFQSHAEIRKDVIETKKLDTWKFLQQEEPRTNSKETIKPNKLNIPIFESQAEIKKEFIETGKLDTGKFLQQEQQQQMQREVVKPKKLEIPMFESQAEIKKEVIETGKLDTNKFLQREEPQTVKREIVKPKKLEIPMFESQAKIKKEVIETGKLDTNKFLQREEPQTMKREIVEPNKLEIPMFESQAEIKKEVIQAGKLETGKSFQQEKQQPIKGEIVQPKKLAIPKFESQAEIKKEVIETGKLDRGRFLQQGMLQREEKEHFKPNRLSIPTFESGVEIKKEGIETKKLDTSRFLYQEEVEATKKESVKPNRVSIPNFDSQIEIKKEGIETKKLDTSRFFYEEERPQAVNREPVKPNRVSIPNFESQTEIKKGDFETKKLDSSRFLYQDETQAMNREVVKPNRVSIPNFERQAEIKKGDFETKKLDTSRFLYREERPQAVNREVVKPNRVSIPNFASQDGIKKGGIETKKLDTSRFLYQEERPQAMNKDSQVRSSLVGNERRDAEERRSAGLMFHQPRSTQHQSYRGDRVATANVYNCVKGDPEATDISVHGGSYNNDNRQDNHHSTNQDNQTNPATQKLNPAYIIESKVTQSKAEPVNFSTPTHEPTSSIYQGKKVIRVGKQSLVQMDKEGNAFVDPNNYRAGESTRDGQFLSRQQRDNQRSGQWTSEQIPSQVDGAKEQKGNQSGYGWNVLNSGQQRYSTNTGSENQGVVQDFSEHKVNSYQETNKREGQTFAGDSSGSNKTGKLQMGQIEVQQNKVPGGPMYGSYSQQQPGGQQVEDQNNDMQAQQQSAKGRFTSQQYQTGGAPAGGANFPALVQKNGKWLVKKVSVDDSKLTYGSTQTTQEVQPLDTKVTMGAKDQNAPQRRELMKEFKQKRSFKHVKNPFGVRKTTYAH